LKKYTTEYQTIYLVELIVTLKDKIMKKLKKLSETMSNADFLVGTLILGFFCMAIMWGVMEIVFELLRLIFKL